jgi:serine/threonine protein kinase
MREQHGPIRKQRGPVRDEANGRRFGNYELVRRIDVGGMGEVYLAHQRTAFGREVAVKIIRSDLVHDLTARERFLREAEVSAHLKHEHILPLFEFGEENGRLFLVTPYIEGGTLAQRLHNGPLPLSEVQQLFTALLRAVSYIHKRGVIHRDLKPSNILLDQEEGSDQIYVRLIDFGIASIQGMTARPPLTQAGTEMGTIAYMAPERLNGIAAASNDIYSLGVILYQMLTGHLPGSGEVAELPPLMDALVRHCITPDPRERIISADELLRSFEYVCGLLRSSPRIQFDQPVQPSAPAAQSEPEPDLPDDAPTPKRLYPSSTSGGVVQASRMLPAVELHIAGGREQGSPFSNEDYNAPTAFIDPAEVQEQRLASEAVVTAAPPTPTLTPEKRKQRKKRSRSMLVFTSLLILIVIALIGGLGFLAFQASLAATITISPQVHAVSKVFTIKARPGLKSIDAGTASVPANVQSDSKTGSQQGPTSGLSCSLTIPPCQQTVSFADVINLVAQIRPGLRTQIQQDLQQRAQAQGAMLAGDIHYTDSNVTFNPQVGAVSDSVTVTLTEVGNVEDVRINDVQSLARQLLQQQMRQQWGANYVLLDQLTHVGQPVIRSIDANGVVTLAVAAGSVAQYQIPNAQIQEIQQHVRGMKKQAALAFVEQQPGVDAHSVAIKLTYGDTLPQNMQQIRILTGNPTTLPPVQLPKV